MADITELRCWPACIDAIDWSPEGIIALASDEIVELLFPNTVSFDRDQDGAHWQHIPLSTPGFSDDELPLKEPAHLRNYSIGEEISTSSPIALSWSPLGLAKYRRCALGVLTANLVLSIWAAEGKPQVESSWGRSLVINHALEGYFSKINEDTPVHVADNLEELVRIRSRIRTFAWAPPLPNRTRAYTLGSRFSYGHHIIAVGNDDNQIAIVIITSPTSTCTFEQGWDAKILAHFPLEIAAETTPSKARSLNNLLRQQKSISKLAWSPWVLRNGTNRSVIVYATNEDVRARLVLLESSSIQYGDEIVYSTIEMRYSGLMKWSPVVDRDGMLTLALFSVNGLEYLQVSTDDASIVERASHDLEGRFDQTSGVMWDTGQYPSPHLHFSSLLSTINYPTSSLKKVSRNLVSLDTPSWRDQIENSAALFSVKNDLRGNSKVKVWGLAMAPLGNFVATCTSVHPSDMVEYGSPNDRRGTVAVSALRKYSQMRESFPAMDVSAEGVLFTLNKLVENAIENTDDIQSFSHEMVRRLIQTYQPIQATQEKEGSLSAPVKSDTLESAVLNFRLSAIFQAQMLRDRFTILVSHACDTTASTALAKTLIAYRLATISQQLCGTIAHTTISRDILRHHKQVTSLVLSVMDTGSPQTPETKAYQNQIGTESSTTMQPDLDGIQSSYMDIPTTITDTCDFCTAPIHFNDIFSATCDNGHLFPRCGLSMLAIQAPGITKYCGICNTPFLCEEWVWLQESDEWDGLNTSQRKGPIGGEHGITGGLSGPESNRQKEMPDLREKRVVSTPSKDCLPQMREDQPNSEPTSIVPFSLARILFLACDTCIYCGGLFI